MSRLITITMADLDYTKTEKYHSVREEWRLNGSLHSVEDEPAVVIDGGSEMQWYNRGLRHREESNGPAWVNAKTGIFLYFNLNKIHRKNGPAWVSPFELKWYDHGELSRRDGPAHIKLKTNHLTSAKKAAVLEDIENISSADLTYYWYWKGHLYKNKEDWAEASDCDPEILLMLKLKYD